MKLTTLDIVFLVLIGLGGLRGLFKGFVSEVFSVAAVVLGVAAAVFFSNAVVPYLVPYLGTTVFTRIAAFLILFLAVFIIVKILEKVVGNISEGLNLGGLDKILGLILGIVEGGLTVAVIIFILTVQPIVDVKALLEGSVIASFLSGIIPTSTEALFEEIKKTGV